MPGGGESYWLVFSGQFGPFPDLVSVDYRNENETFACAFTADENGLFGSITDTEIICRTATGEPEGTYFLVVTVGGQPSEASVDQLIFPAVPIITSIEGCATNQDQGTADCPTVGGISISIYGRNLQAGLVRSQPIHLDSSVPLFCVIHTLTIPKLPLILVCSGGSGGRK